MTTENTNQALKELFALSKKIDQVSFDYKKQQESNKGLFQNDFERNRYHYCNSAFLKMLNLYHSSLLLSAERFGNESKILLRSMFELLINFRYIFMGDNQRAEKLLIRLNTYTKKVVPYYASYRFNNVYCLNQKRKPELNEFYKNLKDEIEHHNVEKNINDFINEYGKNITYWHGKSFSKLFNELNFIIDKNDIGPYFLKLYYWFSVTTHNQEILNIYYNENKYVKYFNIITTPAKGTKVTAKEEVIIEARKNYGYFVLLSNDLKDPIKALEIYRNKDLVEKAFGDLKERLNCNRPAVSSDQSLNGKLFVEFIALIYLSYIKKMMQDKNLFKKHTMHGLLDEFDVIECFEQPGHRLQLGEITKLQTELYESMEITPPTSLH